jgi:hypothetical protein
VPRRAASATGVRRRYRLLLEELPQDRGVRVRGVLGGVDEGDGPFAGLAEQFVEGLVLCHELGPVPRAELGKEGGIMTEGATKSVGGRELLAPGGEAQALLGDAPGPEAVDEVASAIVAGGSLLGPFQADPRDGTG